MKNRKKLIYLLAAGVCSLVMLIAILFIVKYYNDNRQAKNVYESLQNEMVGLTIPSTAPAPTAEPGTGSEPAVEPAPAEIPDDEALFVTPDFAKLQSETNPDIYAWISIPETNINYPVLQHPEDDTYYLLYNIDGSKGYPGCIYTEKENSKDFTDFQTVLYGHNMSAKKYKTTMFHDLHEYKSKDFLAEHPYVYIYLPDRTLRYRIFTAYQYDDRHLLYSFDYASEAGRNGYLTTIFGLRNMTVVRDDQVPVTANDRIITLSTCVANQDNKRMLVQAVLVNDILITDINTYSQQR